MKALLILATLFLVSCSSTMVQDARNKPKYAPKNYQQTGQVKYLSQGADFIINQRREDAFKQMYDACGGEYEITSEETQATSRDISSNGWGGVSARNGDHYTFIDFKCTGQQTERKTAKNCGLIGGMFGCK